MSITWYIWFIARKKWREFLGRERAARLVRPLRRRLPENHLPQSLFVLLGPAVILLCNQYISQQGGAEALDWIAGHTFAAALTWFFLACLTALLYGLTRLMGLSCLLAALVPTALTLISYYKQLINGEPLMLPDFSLAGQFDQVVGFAVDRITLSAPTRGALAILAALLALAVVLDAAALRPSGRTGLRLAGTAGAVLLASLWLAGGTYCVDQYQTCSLQAERDQACGVPLSLLCTALGSRVTGSEAYGELRMNQLLREMENTRTEREEGQLPHIIFVMDESFFDITRMPGLTFDRDPLANYHRLCGEGSDYGRFYTVTTGGGTGWVEMETFTGIPKELLRPDRANTELTAEEYGVLPSYVRVLRDNGYDTVAFHAHTNALYNREENYPCIGFDQVQFFDQYASEGTYEGGYFDDDSTADVLLSLFDQRGEKPLYLYAMTMQNHQPYYAGRYDEDRVGVSSDVLPAEALEMVQCYVNGLYDADQMLGRLTDYFARVDEPVILIFAGDHVPSLYLEETDSVYSLLGYVSSATSAHWSEEEYQRMLSTDYVIWTNFDQGAGRRDSSCLAMGAQVLERAGVDPSPYYAWLAARTQDTLLFHYGSLWVGVDGAIVQPDGEQEAFWRDCGDVVYDLLYGEGYLAGKISRVRGTE